MRAESPMSSIAQGNALGIRYLPTMRPARATLIFHYFLQLPLQGALIVCIRLPRALPWAMEVIGLSARFVLLLPNPPIESPHTYGLHLIIYIGWNWCMPWAMFLCPFMAYNTLSYQKPCLASFRLIKHPHPSKGVLSASKTSPFTVQKDYIFAMPQVLALAKLAIIWHSCKSPWLNFFSFGQYRNNKSVPCPDRMVTWPGTPSLWLKRAVAPKRNHQLFL